MRSAEAGALILNMHSRPNKSEARRSTRIKQEIPVLVTSSDPAHPFSEPGLTLLVNPQGCAVRFGHKLAIGTAVRLEQLPGGRGAGARVVNCIQIADYKQFWLLGLALDEPGNVWGIETPPEDWRLGT
ncbi:MAG TPA: hypothetical protein VJP02_11580 [Candidatus Sulfotelmatobacter sp.]|nr:hypothetical protein [Candidatus Sulfotelmatobacter sp.]